jgi:hypothetical protein
MYSSETGETGGKSATGAVRRLKVGVRSSEHFSLQPARFLIRLPFAGGLGKMGAV